MILYSLTLQSPSAIIQSTDFWFETKIERDQYKMARFFHHFPPINPLNLPLTECILKVLRSFCSTRGVLVGVQFSTPPTLQYGKSVEQEQQAVI